MYILGSPFLAFLCAILILAIVTHPTNLRLDLNLIFDIFNHISQYILEKIPPTFIGRVILIRHTFFYLYKEHFLK